MAFPPLNLYIDRNLNSHTPAKTQNIPAVVLDFEGPKTVGGVLQFPMEFDSPSLEFLKQTIGIPYRHIGVPTRPGMIRGVWCGTDSRQNGLKHDRDIIPPQDAE